MKTPIRRTLVVATAAALVGLSGCATVTQEQLDEAMSMARQAQSDANAAKQAASAAQQTANEARSTASAAQRAASAAQGAADSANSCCSANSEKLERMFRESMRK